MTSPLTPLPIDTVLPSVTQALAKGAHLIITAEPGAGKTTRVPPCIADFLKNTDFQKVIVLQPRRLAARLSAERVAQERGEPCGEFVGYRVRHEQCESSRTKLLFVTEGVFVNMALAPQGLDDVGCVIIDEFHERHIFTDFAFALVLKHLQKKPSSQLHFVMMSATIDATVLAQKIPECAIVHAPGRVFPVRIDHAAMGETAPIEVQFVRALVSLLGDSECPGDILCFFATRFEIERYLKICEQQKFQEKILLLSLYADLPVVEQRKVFEKTPGLRKVILATNVAETSVTIDGVTGVIDGGDAMVLKTSDGSGLPELVRQKISQASCLQRTGRAGRTRSGVCKRLYSVYDFKQRSAYNKPEMLCRDLTQTALSLLTHEQFTESKIMGPLAQCQELPWPEPPDVAQWQAALQVLRLLACVDDNGVTPLGQFLGRFPIHPRLAKLIDEAAREPSVTLAGFFFAALLSEGVSLTKGSPEQQRNSQKERLLTPLGFLQSQQGVFAKLRSAIKEYGRITGVNNTCGSLSHTNPQNLVGQGRRGRVSDVYMRRTQVSDDEPNDARPHFQDWCNFGKIIEVTDEHVFARILVHCFPDRISVGNKSGRREVVLSIESHLQLLLDWDDLRLSGHPFLNETQELVWEQQGKRVRFQNVIRFGDNVIESRFLPLGESEKAAAATLFQRQLQKEWPAPFFDLSGLEELQQRLCLCQVIQPDLEQIDFLGSDFDIFLAHLSESVVAFETLTQRAIEDWAWDLLSEQTKQILNQHAPGRLKLPSGRTVQVHYEPQKSPWIMSKLQDFFGTLASPTVLRHQNVVIHLLAPNGQTIQTTTDLKGFWEKQYAEVRREYQRRYPGHFWPEDPSTSEAKVYKNPRRNHK